MLTKLQVVDWNQGKAGRYHRRLAMDLDANVYSCWGERIRDPEPAAVDPEGN